MELPKTERGVQFLALKERGRGTRKEKKGKELKTVITNSQLKKFEKNREKGKREVKKT